MNSRPRSHKKTDPRRRGRHAAPSVDRKDRRQQELDQPRQNSLVPTSSREDKTPSANFRERGDQGGRSNLSYRRGKKRSLGFKIAMGIIIALLIAGACVAGYFAWDRWLRYDDAAEFQGTWRVENSSQTVTITGDQIVLNDSVSYSYILDSFNKTLDFTYGPYSGKADYAFSEDRRSLLISDDGSEEGLTITLTRGGMQAPISDTTQDSTSDTEQTVQAPTEGDRHDNPAASRQE